MPRCHDKLVRHNEAYGRLTIVKDVMNGKKRTVYARFYPSKKLLEVKAPLTARASCVASGSWVVGTTTTMAMIPTT